MSDANHGNEKRNYFFDKEKSITVLGWVQGRYVNSLDFENKRSRITSDIFKVLYEKYSPQSFKNGLSTNLNAFVSKFSSADESKMIKDYVSYLDTSIKNNIETSYLTLQINILLLPSLLIPDYWKECFVVAGNNSTECAQRLQSLCYLLKDSAEIEKNIHSRDIFNYYLKTFLVKGISETELNKIDQEGLNEFLKQLKVFILSTKTNEDKQILYDLIKMYVKEILKYQKEENMAEIEDAILSFLTVAEQLSNHSLLVQIAECTHEFNKNRQSILIKLLSFFIGEIEKASNQYLCTMKDNTKYFNELEFILQNIDINEFDKDTLLLNKTLDNILPFRIRPIFCDFIKKILDSHLKDKLDNEIIEKYIMDGLENSDEELLSQLCPSKRPINASKSVFNNVLVNDKIRQYFENAIHQNNIDIDQITPIETSCHAFFEQLILTSNDQPDTKTSNIENCNIFFEK